MNLTNLPKPLRRLVRLYIEDARLAVTQRLTILLSSLVTALFVVLLAVAVVIFASVAAASELRQYMSPLAAYSIVAGFYFCLLIIVILFRRQLIVNPLSRLLSRALLSEPNKTNKDDE